MDEPSTTLMPCFARLSVNIHSTYEDANSDWANGADIDDEELRDNLAEDGNIVFDLYQGIDLSSRYWGPTRDIPIESLAALVEDHASTIHGGNDARSCALLLRRNGVYNSVYILSLGNGTRVCVRVPACGSTERWNEKDAMLLRSTVLAMELIGERTTVPLPRVIAYDVSTSNRIGLPYILMSYLDGNSARQAWNSDDWPVPKETRRQNLLRSLAQAMATLNNLKFPMGGSLWFEDGKNRDPWIGESWDLRVEGFVIKRNFEHCNAYVCTRAKLTENLQELLHEEGFPDNCRIITMDNCPNIYMKGVLTLFQLIIETFLDAAEFPQSYEEFVLMHSDYDIQNLLVDDDGNIIGILDWDGVASVPRQIGCSMLPFWLQQDWYSGYRWPPTIGVDYAMLQPDEFDKYRLDFAHYLREASKDSGDWRYTSKSHIYRAVLNSTRDRFDAYGLVQNILADILPRRRGTVYCNQIGWYGFRAGEKEWLRARLSKFFEPAASASAGNGMIPGNE